MFYCEAEIVIRNSHILICQSNKPFEVTVSEKQGFVNIFAASNSSGRSGGGGFDMNSIGSQMTPAVGDKAFNSLCT